MGSGLELSDLKSTSQSDSRSCCALENVGPVAPWVEGISEFKTQRAGHVGILAGM